MKQFCKSYKSLVVYLLLGLALIASIFLLFKNNSPIEIDQTIVRHRQVVDHKSVPISQKQIIKPDFVRGLYLTAYSAGKDDFRQQIIKQIINSRINSVVIDIKDCSGYVLYNSQLETLHQLKTVQPRIPNIKKVLNDFHQANIYVIARQVVFQDPQLAKVRPELSLKTQSGNIWYNYKGLAWVDPQRKEVWKYNLAIAEEAVRLGFDEINFDYVRYPSDGNLKNLNLNLPKNRTKISVLKDFFTYLSDKLSDKTKISIDIFGLVLDQANEQNDLNIGQRLVDMTDYFDYICPMVYPSHYPAGYLGFANPALYPKEIITHSLKMGLPVLQGKRARLRPWLQAFSLGSVYNQEKIQAQINLIEQNTSMDGWVLWNAHNYYPNYIFTQDDY